ncbi:MAG: hypothetical protein E6J00_08440 [Chloroflexi bacterium]|nr:MAG: hypothetical protein E6J00_08440 [Chloroflexota bacterium]
MTRWWWPWGVLVLLGAYHGLNPGMGWLFAVARGLQERRRAALWQSFLPIAIGHEAAIGAVVVLVAFAQLVIAPQALRAGGAGLLLAFAGYRIYRQQAHPRGFGMRVGLRGLFGWSFLMSSAHGAGLMLVPILLSLPPSGANQDLGLVAYAAGLSPWEGLLAATLHTAALLAVMALVAVVVYERYGVAFLRRAWLNVDLIWTIALLGAALVTLFT